MVSKICIYGLEGIPEVKPGDDLAKLIVEAAERNGVEIMDDDVIVVSQKIVSKAENRLVRLRDITPSSFALNLAEAEGKDPRLVELILREAKRIVRVKNGHIIAETRHGFVCANSGVDKSNIPGDDTVSLLPIDPDASAKRIRDRIREIKGVDVAVIISDTFGRAWRIGQVNFAVGVAGMKPTIDYRGLNDPYGYKLKVTAIAVADELAAAAELVMGKLSRIPVAVIRGFKPIRGEGSARELVRPIEEDLFR
jgi:coenzyme F420-0:L-glutamate ligase/coenzyme F420-1:gamma-L-glutamate ligase